MYLEYFNMYLIDVFNMYYFIDVFQFVYFVYFSVLRLRFSHSMMDRSSVMLRHSTKRQFVASKKETQRDSQRLRETQRDQM